MSYACEFDNRLYGKIYIEIGKFHDDKNKWFVGLKSDWDRVFNCEKPFDTKDDCWKYVDAVLKETLKEILESIFNGHER